MARDVVEHVRREVAAVGELDALGAAVGAGLDDLLADLDIRVIEHRDDALLHHGAQDGHAVFDHRALQRANLKIEIEYSSSSSVRFATPLPGSSYRVATRLDERNAGRASLRAAILRQIQGCRNDARGI